MSETAFVLRGNICFSKSKDDLICVPMGLLVCVDGICRGVFEQLPEEYKGLPIHDYGDALIFPGLVDLHIHAPQYAYRGIGMDLELMDWLQQQAFPEEAKYSDTDYAQAAYSIFAEQMRKSATTRACIFATRHRKATILLMDLMEQSGLVSFVGKVNMDLDAPDDLRESDAVHSIQETAAWLASVKGRYERTSPILTPRFIPSCSRQLLEQLQTIQTDYDLPVQSHLSENPEEIHLVKERFPETEFYGDAYDQYGLFGKNHLSGAFSKTIMAHCVYSSEKEIQRIRENGVFIAHCPASNTNLASGIAPVRAYLDAGLHIGLGSDVAAGHSVSIFRAMTDAIQVSKLYWRLCDKTASPLSFPEAFFLATKGGGEFFGMVGSFEPGYGFDAVVLDDSMFPHPQPLSLRERLERAAYLCADAHGIRAKYVAGAQIL